MNLISDLSMTTVGEAAAAGVQFRRVTSPRLMHVTTVPMSLTFLKGQVRYMSARGFQVRAVSSPGEELAAFVASEGVPADAVSMSRRISPLADIVTLVRLCSTIRAWRPHIVHAHTPKAGVLGMV